MNEEQANRLRIIIESANKLNEPGHYGYYETEYINNRVKLKIFCYKCNEFFYQLPNNHKKGCGCPECGKKKSGAGRRKTNDDFLIDAKNIHGDAYEYLDKYNGSDNKINIRCKFHDIIFKQTPSHHIRGDGCPECGRIKTINGTLKSIDAFINEANVVHGVGTYDYILSIYRGANILMDIKCNTCGRIFKQIPSSHLLGCGCPDCGKIKQGLSRRLESANKFESRANEVHDYKYGYMYVKYVDDRTYVSIFCNECNKTFDQTPNNHLAGNGCPDCAIIRNGKKKRITFENFKTRANEIHLNLYGYEISEWVDRNTEIDILCKECNKIFNQLPSSHLNGRGCPDCANKSRSTSQRKSDDIFLAELVNRRGDRYLYLKTKYNGATELITVTCRTHGDFDQRADIHLAGANCPLCVIRVSAPEFDFLNYLNIPNTKEARQYKIKRYKIDGYDANTNTIYEFLGDYYHGNPMRFKPTDYNQKCHKTFKELYDGTFKKLHKLKELGYIVKYIWEYDWERFNNGIDKEPKIITYNC